MAVRVPFRRHHVGSFAGEQVLRPIAATGTAINQLSGAVEAMPFGGKSRLVKGIVFVAATAQDVSHGLGSLNVGFIVVRSYGTNVANGIGESGTDPPDPKNQKQLITTLAGTRDILFFVLPDA